MIISLSYNSKSAAQAQKLVDRIYDLGWPANFVLCRETSAPDLENVPSTATKITYVDHINRPIESKNLAFQAVATWVRAKSSESFLYLEPDCVPRRPHWVAEIEAEYRSCGKPFMGPIVESTEHATPRHMAAIAVYPWRMIALGGGEALIANEVPFPAAMARGILTKVHPTNLIQHDWQGLGPSDDCAIYHPDRDGKILENLPVPALAEPDRTPQKSAPATAGRSGEARGSDDDKRPDSSFRDPLRRANISGAAAGTHLDGAQVESPDSPKAASEPLIKTSFVSEAAPPYVVPWENKLDSQERIKSLASELKRFCASPRQTAIVRAELRAAGVTGGPVAVKRRRRRKKK